MPLFSRQTKLSNSSLEVVMGHHAYLALLTQTYKATAMHGGELQALLPPPKSLLFHLANQNPSVKKKS